MGLYEIGLTLDVGAEVDAFLAGRPARYPIA